MLDQVIVKMVVFWNQRADGDIAWEVLGKTLNADEMSKDNISWEIFFRSILDSFETHHMPSTPSIPPLVFENTTGAHNKQQFQKNVNK